MNTNSSVFNVKDTESINMSILKNDLLNSIPKNATSEENIIFAKYKTEWRWRIFKFPEKDNEVVEISKKEPNKNRLYINKNGDWVERNIDKSFDKYVIEQYYAYLI